MWNTLIKWMIEWCFNQILPLFLLHVRTTLKSECVGRFIKKHFKDIRESLDSVVKANLIKSPVLWYCKLSKETRDISFIFYILFYFLTFNWTRILLYCIISFLYAHICGYIYIYKILNYIHIYIIWWVHFCCSYTNNFRAGHSPLSNR